MTQPPSPAIHDQPAWHLELLDAPTKAQPLRPQSHTHKQKPNYPQLTCKCGMRTNPLHHTHPAVGLPLKQRHEDRTKQAKGLLGSKQAQAHQTLFSSRVGQEEPRTVVCANHLRDPNRLARQHLQKNNKTQNTQRSFQPANNQRTTTTQHNRQRLNPLPPASSHRRFLELLLPTSSPSSSDTHSASTIGPSLVLLPPRPPPPLP